MGVIRRLKGIAKGIAHTLKIKDNREIGGESDNYMSCYTDFMAKHYKWRIQRHELMGNMYIYEI